MLTGDPTARMQIGAAPDGSSFGIIPADLDGAAAPPAGAPNFFIDNSGFGTLREFKYHVDWETPANSTWTGPLTIPTAPFTRVDCPSSACIPQPGTAQKLDPLSPRPMFRAAYRNFGDHEFLGLTST